MLNFLCILKIILVYSKVRFYYINWLIWVHLKCFEYLQLKNLSTPKNLRTLKTNFEKADVLGRRQITLRYLSNKQAHLSISEQFSTLPANFHVMQWMKNSTLLAIKKLLCHFSRCLSVLDFWNVNLGVYYKHEKKSISKQTWFFVEFELDFYCLCSLQKSISKWNWFF